MLLKPLDVAIGLAFFFLLLTFVASALVEMVSNLRNWRAEMLYAAIDNMLKNSDLVTSENVYQNPQVKALSRNDAAKSWVDVFDRFGWRPPTEDSAGTPPSYIPAGVFSAAILNKLNTSGAVPALSPEQSLQTLQALLTAKPPKGVGKDALRSVLTTTLATQGASVQALRVAIEKWYNDTMDRTSGWYKRRTQTCLLMIGLLVALGANIDTLTVTSWLWQGDAAREAVVSAAADYVKNHPMPVGAVKAVTPAAKASAPPALPVQPTVASYGAQLVEADRQLLALQYPVGWPHADEGALWILKYLAGCLITAIAISMGSSFWFDSLQNLIKLRGAGPKPGPR
jgi:hypothetical protein